MYYTIKNCKSLRRLPLTKKKNCQKLSSRGIISYHKHLKNHIESKPVIVEGRYYKLILNIQVKKNIKAS